MHKKFKDIIYYFTQVHNSFPSKIANNIQVLNMCKGFENNGQKVILVNALCRENYFRSFRIKNLVGEMFGISIKSEFSWIKFYYPFPWFKQLIYAFYVLIFVIKNKVTLSYTRSDLIMILLLSANKNSVFEAHQANRKVCLRMMSRLIKLKKNIKNIKIIVISYELKKEFLKIGFPEEIIQVEHDAVDLERFNISYNRNQLRRKLELPIDKRIITYSGSLQAGRGIEIILDCASMLSNYLFLIIGGRTSEEIEYYKSISKNKKNIIFLGFVYQELIVKYLSASNILLMPHTENCDIIKYTSPMKMFEYMASKTPIISSDFPVFREILNEQNALLIFPSDSGLLSNAINKIITNKSYAKSLSNQAYKDVQNYTWEKRAARISKFILNNG